MDRLLDMLKADLQLKSVPEITTLYVGLTGDLLGAMDRLDDMLRKYLAGAPVPVIQLTNESLST